ncbi:MAG: cell division ATP-binding protein FtsE [Gammaproteobacteria bacterium]|nr:cell division ATP-binding protein FtsE [Gammaproteobacteria bacterium]MCP5136241.1 cell division ATP-binding protein FtsE [Gammaproteobacteria bacterium]
MIRFQSVTKRYPDNAEALSSVSFRLGEGAMAFLTGHSGAGKSTLLKLIALIERPTQGEIEIDGLNLAGIRGRHIAHFRRRLGIVFQNHGLLMDRTVFDNVALPLVIAGFRHQDIAKRVHAALDMVGLLRHEKKLPVTLSAGEQQRVGIARAVVNKPTVLLADEPTGNLDPELSREVMHLFEQFNQVGVTILVATHDIDLIRSLDHPALRLDHGKLSLDTELGSAAE